MKFKDCEYCKKPFTSNDHLSRRRFCSASCSALRNNRGFKYNCFTCGIEVKSCKSEIGIRKYCSNKCSIIARTTRLKVNCKNCNKEYEVQRLLVSKVGCCSDKCRKEYRSTEIKCVICDKIFRLRNSHIRGRKCCSKKCQSIHFKTTQKGKLNPNYRHGLCLDSKNIRRRQLYKECRKIKTHTKKEWLTLKEQYGFKCACCKKQEPEIKLTKDHIISISNLGHDGIDNIQPLCQRCNSKKSAKNIKYEINRIVL